MVYRTKCCLKVVAIHFHLFHALTFDSMADKFYFNINGELSVTLRSRFIDLEFQTVKLYAISKKLFHNYWYSIKYPNLS